ncbi:hypothetical protein QJS10_CPB17g01825 [Acorus calamus]|uniref:Reverse transcriptase zinc-binding domain-containing protein n=1 Tax=Acorus calamus TaxID=4465 RepID=A0AAV9CRS4_ACOCL|nr:hypothetical protein QJS10_CPB17g01825 [Acorus calamus]
MQADTLCPMCGVAEEITEHLFVDCSFARHIWLLLKETTGFDPGFNSPQDLWEAGRKLNKKGDRSPSVVHLDVDRTFS